MLREIRTAGERFDPDLPVLVLSGRCSEADRLRGFEAGADDYLSKPTHYCFSPIRLHTGDGAAN